MNTKTEIFAQLTEKAATTYKKKNHDYGDSFAKTRATIPGAILVRLHDKLNRLTTLLTNPDQAQVKDESIDDTLLDLANYALMELTERIYERKLEEAKKCRAGGEPLAVFCNYNDKGRCMGQKGMPECTPGTGYCPETVVTFDPKAHK